jgi:DNA-binding SARP family transcriptional activator
MLDVCVLGPTEARVSGVSVSLSPLERNLLAVLALSSGTVLSTERIINCLWGERHPASPRSRVQGLVSSIRRKIGDALVTRHPGYLLDADELSLDLAECEDLARQARTATSVSHAAGYLRKALELWRGDPLDGVTAPGIEFDRMRLAEMRLGLLEERFDADLELGRHAELVAELTATVSAHPLREKLAGQLMLALYRSNRQADALKVYQALRQRLAEELGSDPCADVRNLHATILRGEGNEARADPVAEIRPAQLPPGVGHFTGRDHELTALTRAVALPAEEPCVLVVAGVGGLGKTALVIRWAHLIAERFPDGQIFVDLHARESGETLPPGDALGVVLGALGTSWADLPISVDERAALYRTLTSGRRVLIVADDAGSLDQVLPLVPPTAASRLVVTSRRRLTALAAHHAVEAFRLEPLSHASTLDLLGRIVGTQRLRDPAANRLAQWCGGWPLMIRLAGSQLAARPWQTLASFVDELEEHADLNLVLDEDHRSVRSALAGAYRGLSPAAAHLFGRLGYGPSSLRLPGTGVAADTRRLRRLFDELVAAGLVVDVGADRYRVHDLVRRFARQCSADLMDRDTIDEWARQCDLPVTEPADRMADLHRI